MKNLIFSAAMVLIATVFISAFPTDAEAKIYEDTLRLHILANSDSVNDQELKLKIRDKILEKYGDLLSSADSLEDAKTITEKVLPLIEADAERWICDAGYDYSVSATLTEEWYDTREYEDFALPAGRYHSLRVIIGEGDGQNWWCVMYPPLCMEMATEKAPADDGIIDYSKEEVTLIKSGKYNIKFKILEILSTAFTKNS